MDQKLDTEPPPGVTRVCVRPSTEKDAKGMMAVDDYLYSSSNQRSRRDPEDNVRSPRDMKKMLRNAEDLRPQGLIYLVAENLTKTQIQGIPPGGLFGYAYIKKYKADATGKPLRPHFQHVALIRPAIIGASVLGRILYDKVQRMLVEEAAAWAHLQHYKHAIIEVPTAKNRPALKANVDAYEKLGFAQVGLLKGVIASDEFVLDEAILQKTF